jgi:DmsE family decaheme c-type cytochrome
MRNAVWAVIVAAAFVASGRVAAAQSAPPPTAWSASDCATCHEKAVTKEFQHSAHAQANQSCAQCHSDVADHFRAQTGGTKGPSPSLKTIGMKAANDVCLKCHEKGARTNWRGGMHDRRETGCISCHSVHTFSSPKAQLKTVRDADTCFTCHKQIRAKVQRASHHPLREGKIDCSSCHNPHDSTQPKMISAASINDKCYECHAEKRGPFLWEHAPVRENCASCHDPHGSNHPRLTIAKLPQLCQRCHMNGGHQSNVYDLNNGPGGALVAPPAVNGVAQVTVNPRALNRSCVNCHIQTHGSNSPSGVFYGR